jgi:hypothetical protein
MAGPASPSGDSTLPDRDEFFIGWLPAPRRYVRFLRPLVGVLLLASVGAAVLVATRQRDPGPGRWDNDGIVTFSGVAEVGPYAAVRVPGERPGDPPRTLLLVEEGKFGAPPRVAPLRDQAVRVTGTLLHRDGRALLELAAGGQGLRRLTAVEARALPSLARPEPRVLAERATLVGEVIDPKCYLGAMKPGGGKTHKACAMLCVSGGVPPMLVTRAADRRETFYLLATSDGGPANELVLPFVGDTVEAAGRLEWRGELLVLKIAADGIRRR